jgi:hypothetical protein
MKRATSVKSGTSRRSFLRSGIVSAGGSTVSATVTGSIIRPTGTQRGGAVATIERFKRGGLFIGQDDDFTQSLFTLAGAADRATPEV